MPTITYETASTIIINGNGAALKNCSPQVLAKIATGGAPNAQAALVVLEHDYITSMHDREYYERTYGIPKRGA